MEENAMARQQTSRGRKQDRARVAGGQDYEVGYEAAKMRKSRSTVKKTVKKVGNSRKRVEQRLLCLQLGSALFVNRHDCIACSAARCPSGVISYLPFRSISHPDRTNSFATGTRPSGWELPG